MNDIELKLKEYLLKNTEIIEESLKSNYLNYDFIKVNSIEIENDEFSVKCQIIKGMSCDITSTFIPIPKKFLRKYKLEKIIKKN